MLIIKVKNKNIEAALKNYKYKVYKTKQLQNLNEFQDKALKEINDCF